MIVLPATATTLNRSYDEAIKKIIELIFLIKKNHIIYLMKYHEIICFDIGQNFLSKKIKSSGKTVEDNFILLEKIRWQPIAMNFYLLKENPQYYLIN